MATFSGSPTASLHRSTRHNRQPDATHGVLNVSPTHSRRDLVSVDYGLWSFDDRDYNIVYIVTNNTVNTELSLWKLLLSEDARRPAFVQYRGRCCNCGSTEYSLRWCPAPFENIFSLLHPESGTHDPDGPVFETWKVRVRRWRQRGSPRRRGSNNRRNDTVIGRSRYSNNRGHIPTYQGNHTGITRASDPAGREHSRGDLHLAFRIIPPQCPPYYEARANTNRSTKRE